MNLFGDTLNEGKKLLHLHLQVETVKWDPRKKLLNSFSSFLSHTLILLFVSWKPLLVFRSLGTMEKVLSLVSSDTILLINFLWSVSRHVSTDQIFEELEILDMLFHYSWFNGQLLVSWWNYLSCIDMNCVRMKWVIEWMKRTSDGNGMKAESWRLLVIDRMNTDPGEIKKWIWFQHRWNVVGVFMLHFIRNTKLVLLFPVSWQLSFDFFALLSSLLSVVLFDFFALLSSFLSVVLVFT